MWEKKNTRLMTMTEGVTVLFLFLCSPLLIIIACEGTREALVGQGHPEKEYATYSQQGGRDSPLPAAPSAQMGFGAVTPPPTSSCHTYSSLSSTSSSSASSLADGEVSGSIVNISEEDLARCVVSLNGEAYTAAPNRDGSFALNGVALGTYILEVTHPHLVFKPLFVERSLRQSSTKTSAYVHTLEHGKGRMLGYPLQIEPSGFHIYFQAREEFNILALLKNPMILIGLVCMCLVVLLPKLQNSVDPEALQELGSRVNGQSGADASGYTSAFVQSLTARHSAS